MKPIPVGTKGHEKKTVAASDLASHLDSTLASVLSTPTMISMMEHAAIDAISTYLEPGESSVGMSIEVNHTAATPLGITSAPRLNSRRSTDAGSNFQCAPSTKSSRLAPEPIAAP